MSKTALGWRSHSGWAALVVVREPASRPQVLAKRRVELIGESLPRQPYHAIVEGGLAMPAATSLIERVATASVAAVVAATEWVLEEFAVEAVAVVGRRRSIPHDLERVLASHALLHAAEGYLYECSLIDGATRVGLPVSLVEPERIEVGTALDAAGKALGPPWQKDHKLAAAAALAVLQS